MRCIILICTLLAAPLCALDSENIDGETLRLTRHVLLQDEIRRHFNLRIGEFQPLSQALLARATLDGRERKVITLRKDTHGCVAIIERKDGKVAVLAWLFLDVEGEMGSAEAAGGLVVTSEIKDEGGNRRVKQRARYLRFDGETLRLAHTYDSRIEQRFEDDDYEVVSTASIKKDEGQFMLTSVTEYRQDGEPIEEGPSTRRWKLVEREGVLERELVEPGTLDVSTHTGIARRLERQGLENAALYHARVAQSLADATSLEASDPRRQEAVTLVTKLEARLRNEVVEK